MSTRRFDPELNQGRFSNVALYLPTERHFSSAEFYEISFWTKWLVYGNLPKADLPIVLPHRSTLNRDYFGDRQ
jgi:hypothetical protein